MADKCAEFEVAEQEFERDHAPETIAAAKTYATAMETYNEAYNNLSDLARKDIYRTTAGRLETGLFSSDAIGRASDPLGSPGANTGDLDWKKEDSFENERHTLSDMLLAAAKVSDKGSNQQKELTDLRDLLLIDGKNGYKELVDKKDPLDEYFAADKACKEAQAYGAALSSAGQGEEFGSRAGTRRDYVDENLAAAAAALKAANEKETLWSDLGGFGFKDIRFKEQCLLLANIQEFAQAKKDYLDPLHPAGLHGGSELDKAAAIVDWAPPSKQLPYVGQSRNASLLLDGDPYALINVLTQPPNKETFFEMETQAISALQPMIRLYKVISDEEGNEYQIEMNFDSHYSKKDVADFLNPGVRGRGVGLKSFNFTYEATNLFAIKKAIRAKLVLHANSFSELLRDRPGLLDQGSGISPRFVDRNYKYTDLAMKTAGSKTFELDRGDQGSTIIDTSKLNFRLKAIVGWANPTGADTNIISTKLKNAIYNSPITLNLTPTVHHFALDELGRTTFTINYLAYVEDFFDQPQFNIFTKADVTANQIVRKLKYKAFSKKCNSEESQKELEKLKNDPEQVQLIENEKTLNTQALLESMIENKKIKSINIPLNKLDDYRVGGPFGKIDDEFIDLVRKSGAVEVTVDAAQRARTTGPPAAGDDTPPSDGFVATLDFYGNITFFYVSDLIDVILKNIENSLDEVQNQLVSAMALNEEIEEDLREEYTNYVRFAVNFKKFRILLGPVEFTDDTGETIVKRRFNLGDIPISAKYFLEFLTERVLKKERTIYPLATFLNEFFNQFIRDFLNNDTCYGNRAKQKVTLSQAAITAYKKEVTEHDTITEWCYGKTKTRMDISEWSAENTYPILATMGKRDNAVPDEGLDSEIYYLTYFAGRVQPSELQNGKKDEDHPRGIWHYQIGKDRGIVKTIDLVKTDSPGLAEVRFEQHGYDGLQQLRVLYDANIKTVLDVNSYPGSYIYIEPRGFDPAAQAGGLDLTQFGIGGYYMIIRSSHALGPGLAETEITAKWVAEIAHEEASTSAGPQQVSASANCTALGATLQAEMTSIAEETAAQIRWPPEEQSTRNGAKVVDEHTGDLRYTGAGRGGKVTTTTPGGRTSTRYKSSRAE